MLHALYIMLQTAQPGFQAFDADRQLVRLVTVLLQTAAMLLQLFLQTVTLSQ